MIESTSCLIEKRYGEFYIEHDIADPPEATAWIRSVCRSETPIDIVFEGEGVIRLSSDWPIRILHTPGHSAGHLSIWDERSKTALIADAALWTCLPERGGRPAFPPTYRYVEDYEATIRRLQQLGADRLLTSHYPLLAGADVDVFLEESLAFMGRLDQALRGELTAAGHPLSTRELIERLSPQLGTWPAAASQYLIFPLIGHLERLERSNKVCRCYADCLVRWAATTRL